MPEPPDLAPALRAALDERQDPAWIFDVDREAMVYGNAAACAFWRAEDVAALVARDFAGDMSDATRSRLAATRAAVEEGEVVHAQWTLYPASQAPKTIELRAERAELRDGRLALLFSSARGQSVPDEALRGIEAVRHTTVMVTLFDADGTRALFANPACVARYGPDTAWRGLWGGRFADEGEGRRVLEALRSGHEVSVDARMRTRLGVRWHAVHARVTADPVRGESAILLDEHDIEAAKRAEADLRKAREELEHRVLLRTTELAASRDFVSTVLDSLDALVLVVEGGLIRWANATARRALGDVRGRTPTSVPGLPANGTAGELALGDERGERLIHWTVTDPGGPDRRTLLTGVDVTDRAALQEQVALNDRMTSLGTLAAGIAHELNNPFAVVRANLEVMRDELAARPSDPLSAPVTDALAGMERAARIVADLRAYTRVEEDAQPIELRTLVEGAVGLAAGPLRGLTVRLEVPADVYVQGVEGLLTQVLLNLLINAAQSVGEPPGTVEVLAAVEDARVRIAVVDDGPGLDRTLLRRAFDPFFTTKQIGEGTGLGLYVCQRIVQSHGGTIRFDTLVERGARVLVTLPKAAPARAHTLPTVRATQAAGARRVLVVDDDLAVLRALKRLLRGHTVDLASSGEQALAILLDVGAAGYDMVLCDLMMPGMPGDALFARVEEELPPVAKRFVFMSGGLPYRSSIGEFVGRVDNRFLQKPVERAALARALDALPPVEAADREPGCC